MLRYLLSKPIKLFIDWANKSTKHRRHIEAIYTVIAQGSTKYYTKKSSA